MMDGGNGPQRFEALEKTTPLRGGVKLGVYGAWPIGVAPRGYNYPTRRIPTCDESHR